MRWRTMLIATLIPSILFLTPLGSYVQSVGDPSGLATNGSTVSTILAQAVEPVPDNDVHIRPVDWRSVIPAGGEMMFALLAHLTVIFGFVVLIVLLLWMAFDTSDAIEQLIRVSAFATGLIIVLGTKAVGLGLADSLVRVLGESGPLAFGALDVLLPGVVGVFAAWFITSPLLGRSAAVKRSMILVEMLIVTQFIDIYLKAIGRGGLSLNSALVPNLVFLVTVSLYVLLRYESRAASVPSDETPVESQRRVDEIVSRALELKRGINDEVEKRVA